MKSSHAGFPEPFHIELNGHRMFVGDTDQPGTHTYTEILKSQLGSADIRLEENSMFQGNRAANVSLNGQILFSIGDLPKMRVQKLRLIYHPENREQGQYSNGWKIHPEDASSIVAYFETVEGPAMLRKQLRKQQLQLFLIWSPLLFYGFTILTLFTVLCWLRRYRLKHVASNLLLNPPIDR